jgi:hypothetical protein
MHPATRHYRNVCVTCGANIGTSIRQEAPVKLTAELLLRRAKQEARKAEDALRRGRCLAAVYAHREKAVMYQAKALLKNHSETCP